MDIEPDDGALPAFVGSMLSNLDMVIREGAVIDESIREHREMWVLLYRASLGFDVRPADESFSNVAAAMARGTLRLSNGLGATCEYEVTDEAGGRMRLPNALYLPRRERDVGTLQLSDGEHRKVQITFGPAVGEASFSFMD